MFNCYQSVIYKQTLSYRLDTLVSHAPKDLCYLPSLSVKQQTSFTQNKPIHLVYCPTTGHFLPPPMLSPTVCLISLPQIPARDNPLQNRERQGYERA